MIEALRREFAELLSRTDYALEEDLVRAAVRQYLKARLRILERDRDPVRHALHIRRIVSEDGTWHRPFTTLELAALQGLVDVGEHLELEGTSDTAWRERIGNAVPSPAAAAIASVMGRALLLAWAGETFSLDAMPVWVRKLAVAAIVETR